jgi:hypothetical protein
MNLLPLRLPPGVDRAKPSSERRSYRDPRPRRDEPYRG